MIRIVKMTFQEDKVDAFVEHFKLSKPTIEGFEGCSQVKLLNDINQKNVFFTYSIWEDETFLNRYRSSDFFIKTWNTVKPWFSDKASAWSVDEIV